MTKHFSPFDGPALKNPELFAHLKIKGVDVIHDVSPHFDGGMHSFEKVFVRPNILVVKDVIE